MDARTKKQVESYIARVERNSELRELPKAAHTPGPWSADDDYCLTIEGNINEDARTVAILPDEKDETVDFVDDPTERIANARLIAAAPELLAALKAAFDMVKNCPGNWDNQVRDMLNIAIARAEGK
jgi:hypothetical protein